MQDLLNLLSSSAEKTAIFQDAPNHHTIVCGTMSQRMDDGQCGFTFAKITGHGFSQNFFRRGQIENIIDNLESEADGPGHSWPELLPGRGLPPASVAPSFIETEKRQAVLRKMRS